MQHLRRVAWFVAFLLACSPASAQVAGDEAAIRELATRWADAWSRHDMRELFSFVTEDADFVNVGARHWKGRQQIEAEHTSRVKKGSEWWLRAAQNTNLGPLAAKER